MPDFFVAEHFGLRNYRQGDLASRVEKHQSHQLVEPGKYSTCVLIEPGF
jgi:hypothetical protein